MALCCTRCKFDGLVVSKASLNVVGAVIELTKYACPQCGTRLYFEEDVLAYVTAVADAASKKQ